MQPQEDPSKFFPTKCNRPREVKAQSRGERGLQRRYVPDDTFTKLDREEINLEIEAEAVKQKYKEQKGVSSRRHYHTKNVEPVKPVGPVWPLRAIHPIANPDGPAASASATPAVATSRLPTGAEKQA
ncbi:unnamed protein product [Bemisia tabaci]|uniref:Uncharacterized protein n=1 Tax=Bemisia tabaci TaxID=7038 RepID=A0A9P0A431_BEMTA|nr:unnamed protein product [Bemisia tabaci]